ncbi:hypothetical protein Cni_G09886 [Canna indica]|uniref:Uncharacterized protein n=1 Tax=Canna indica TaxID=4628 RepID=A0AAQ3K6I8_9LILI|nr:hypothetical protein Cni_G09886 [Canna indica]
MEDFGDLKRRRHQAVEEEEDSPVAKRFRDDLLIDILDDDDGAGEHELVSVMKSLEEEIAILPPPPSLGVSVAPNQPDLGYLFEASDDELGLPPPAPCSSDEGGDAPETVISIANEGDRNVIEFGQIWGFADEINGYDGFDFSFQPEDGVVVADAAEEGMVFEGGLFDYADGPFDLTEISWRS